MPESRVPVLAGVEIVGAVGLAVPVVGVLAAAGILLHLVLGVVALVTLVLRAATA